MWSALEWYFQLPRTCMIFQMSINSPTVILFLKCELGQIKLGVNYTASNSNYYGTGCQINMHEVGNGQGEHMRPPIKTAQ